MREYSAIIGLECHAQLNTRSKLFCPCPVGEGPDRSETEPNRNICPICMGHPGTLPTLNQAAVALAIRAALATGSTIHSTSFFARKHYFYPDLPKGFQITQAAHPIATGGAIHARGERFRIHRIHLEEDSGKSFHTDTGTLLDWNRAGVPLIEIVSEADFTTAEQAESYLRTLHRVLVEAGVCLGDLEKGHFRCDANVSVHRDGEPWGTKVEIKNVNSFRFVAKAIRFEIDRQTTVLQSGQSVEQETRTWAGNRTVSLRKKEGRADYRYLPEPDLMPLVLSADEIASERNALPGVPMDLHLARLDDAEVQDWCGRYGLDIAAVRTLVGADGAVQLFVDAVGAGGEAKAMANWVIHDVLSREGTGQLTGVHLRDLQALIDKGTLTRDSAKRVVGALWTHGGVAADVVSRQQITVIADPDVLRTAIADVFAAYPKQLVQYREGNRGLLGFFMGKLMAHTERRADPALLQRLLLAALETSAG